MKSKQMSIFYEKLGQLYAAGVPIDEGLAIASLEVKDVGLQRGLERLHGYVVRGRTLAEGVAQSPEVFSEMEAALIQVGEARGRLDESLRRLSEIKEKDYKNLKRFLIGMAYPVFLIVGAIFIPPIVSLFTTGLQAYIEQVLGSLLVVVLPIAAAVLIYIALKKGFRDDFDRLILAFPFLGNNLKKLALARFCRSFSALFSSGLEMRACLKHATAAMSNRYLQRRARVVQTAIDEGETLTRALSVASIFPSQLVQMIATGERTGNLDQMLDKAAGYYEFEAERAIKAILIAIPFVVYMLVAVYIAYIVISFYAGYFKMIGDLTK